MRSSLARKAVVILLAYSLSVSSIAFAQDSSHQETRPRRANEPTTQKSDPLPRQDAWQTPVTTAVTLNNATTTTAGPEPTIRVALATDARSGSISTEAGKLMNATGASTMFVALNVARVRVEPRLLSPLPASLEQDYYRIKIEGAVSRAEAEQKAREIRELVDEDSQITFNSETTTWGLLVGPRRSREESDELQARLDQAGFDAVVFQSGIPASADQSSQAATKRSGAPMTIQSSIRLAARASLPSREVVALAPSAGRLFSSSAPIVFASEDETRTRVRFNDRPYRGRLEVFTNSRGNLTVVNVLGLEDSVKGVVANELSPGGWPAIEALKAQAIAARTYALRNRGQFLSQGFDLLPTTRSQVYRGLTSEHALSTRAVDETRGLVATFAGEPINALYTSTCGGRTENSENIFNDTVPYLRGHECAVEGRAALATFIIKSTRTPSELREEKHVPLSRDVALLSIQGFASLPSRVSDDWLAESASVSEVQNWLTSVARLAHQTAPAIGEDINRPPAFATAVSSAIFGESRGDTLLNNADVDYFLAIRDAGDVPVANRADLALLLREGYLAVYPDATLRPREPLSRARVLHTLARILEARNLLQIQKGTARPTSSGTLVLRSTKGKDQPIAVNANAYLFRQIGEGVYPVRSVVVVGGEPVTFHVSASGEVDYLEVRPAPNGASAERFSPFTNWTTELSLGQIQARLARSARGIGPITDLRVAMRGSSRRAIDLELIGNQGTAHVRGGQIRSRLGLREQLFVMERKYGADGRVTGFVFYGRGWGHGVGMCQVGAYGLARQGLTSEQILKAYYSGIELTRLY